MITRILFFGAGDAGGACMATGFARLHADAQTEVLCATLTEVPADSLVGRLMREVGVALDERASCTPAALYRQTYDVVITLGAQAEASCPLLPGCPAQLCWPIPGPDVLPASPEPQREAACRALRDQIANRVETFFTQGYLEAFVAQRSTDSLILDNVSDGIMAHDLQRRIVFFNAAAETLTGRSRDNVLGRDCHDVFEGRFCGGKCRFCDPPAPLPNASRQEMEFLAADGTPRLLDTRIKPLRTRQGREIGVLLSFRDHTREQELARRVGDIQNFAGIIGRDAKMQSVYELVRDVAPANVPVLIEGESGTGKELVAAAIHNESPRANRLFVPVNCGALPEGILESELFGHVKGAFTGAVRDKKGRFELADGGTIFLDEIGDIPPAMQVRLLRVLQEGTFERVGDEKTIRVDVRLISATNRDLRQEIESGRFREDLFYRLNVMPLCLPPLRERRIDIPLLAEHFLKRFAAEMQRESLSFSPAAMEKLMDHDWPGNVRELQNWIQYALIKCRGTRIEPGHLPPPAGRLPTAVGSVPAPRRLRGGRRGLSPESVRDMLDACGGNRVEAARRLGVSRATLYRYFADHPELQV